jgi:L-iditol 2-dehydrogenase
MRSFELRARQHIVLNERAEVPKVGPSEVLVRVMACTVCNRSDLVYYHYLGQREHCAVGCFGHEVAGTVEKVGSHVTRVRPGQRVFVRTPLTSGFAEFALAREISVGALPDAIPFEQGAILQLLPLAIHATRGVRLGDHVLILGQGPVGLMAMQVARCRGAAHIVAADLDPWRLERSRELGADRTLLADAEFGGGFDVAIDAVGTPGTANTCMTQVRQNGLIVLLGTHHVDTHVTFDLVAWEKKGLRVHSSAEPTDIARTNAMAVAERLISRKDTGIRLDRMLTHVYSLGALPKAIDQLSASPVLFPADGETPYDMPPAETLKIAICP